MPFPISNSSCKSSFDCTEKFRSLQIVRYASTIDGNKGFVTSITITVYHLGYHFLTAATRTEYHN